MPGKVLVTPHPDSPAVCGSFRGDNYPAAGGLAVSAVSAKQMELGRLRAELAKTKMELVIIKSGSALCVGIDLKYAWIDRNRGHLPSIGDVYENRAAAYTRA